MRKKQQVPPQEQLTKLCKHCKTEIPKAAKVCPNCRKKQKGKGGLIALIIIIILILIIVIAASSGGDDGTKIDNSNAATSENPDANVTDESQNIEDSNEAEDVEDIDASSADDSDTPVEITEDEFKAQCQEYNYKDVMRNPEDYIGQKIKVTVKVLSVHTSNFTDYEKYYFAWSDDGSDFWFENEYGILDYRAEDDFKILEDDIIAVYGEISEPQETTSVIVNSEELFCIDMKYAELLDE